MDEEYRVIHIRDVKSINAVDKGKVLVLFEDGAKEYLLNGKRHREDGPAYIYSGGRKEWHYHGQWLRQVKSSRKKSLNGW